MTVFIEVGTRVRLPSGLQGSFVRWSARVIDKSAPRTEREYERVAVLKVNGEVLEFSERFMRRVLVVEA
ncbi:MAG: hypothetical protein CML17_00780 [Pusillimonas sp.]|jgi:hypothetical protein|nr:hypothetical protein [Pusillimonas sp.]